MARLRYVPACVLLAAVGCDGSKPAVPKVSYDPATAAQVMLSEYDTNKNGEIDGAELDACPSLKSALANFDTNKDKKISLEELTARFTAYVQANTGASGIGVRVMLNGAPVANATVTFTPEKCFADLLQGGKATTRGDGIASPVRADGVPGLSPGLYRVTVTGDNVPAEYGSQNLLGLEVGSGGRDTPNTELRLTAQKSK